VSGDTFQVVPGLQISAVKHTVNGEMPSCQIVAVHGNGATINSADLDIGLFDGADVQLYVVDRRNLTRKGLLFSGSIATISYDVENQVTLPQTHTVPKHKPAARFGISKSERSSVPLAT
jgi:hypothetical protein